MTKVKVTKAQEQLIENALRRYDNDRTRAALNYVHSKELPQTLFVRCMIEGWEVEKSKEDQILELFNSYSNQGSMRPIIRKVLTILEMKIKGIND